MSYNFQTDLVNAAQQYRSKMENTAGQAVTQRSIDIALDRLEQRISAMNQVATDLDNKLSPYLHAAVPDAEVSDKVNAEGMPHSNNSRVVNKLESFANHVDSIRAFLYSLIERLD